MNKITIAIDTLKVAYLAASNKLSCTSQEAYHLFNWPTEYANSIIDYAKSLGYIHITLEQLLKNKTDEYQITPLGQKTLLDLNILNRKGLIPLDQLDNHLERVVKE